MAVKLSWSAGGKLRYPGEGGCTAGERAGRRKTELQAADDLQSEEADDF